MIGLSAERISVILEVLSFIFVTTELYGQRRLTTMVAWLPAFTLRGLFYLAIVFLALWGLASFLRSFVLPPSDDRDLDFISLLILSPLLIACAQAGLLLFLAFAKSLIAGYNQTGESKGRYILIGTALFMLSKAIVFF